MRSVFAMRILNTSLCCRLQAPWDARLILAMHTDSTLLGDARVRVEEPDAELPVVLDGTTTTTVTTVTIVTTVPRG